MSGWTTHAWVSGRLWLRLIEDRDGTPTVVFTTVVPYWEPIPPHRGDAERVNHATVAEFGPFPEPMTRSDWKEFAQKLNQRLWVFCEQVTHDTR